MHDHLIEGILPAHQVHIINGPSGVGKTRWINWWYKGWQNSEPFFGYESHPVPTIYLAKDRNIESLNLTLKSMGCENLMDHGSLIYRPEVTIDSLSRHYPDKKLFILDPIAKFLRSGKINDYSAVSDFLIDCSRICLRDQITILGSCHSPKKKEGQRYLNPREWTLGSGAWGGYSETMFAFDGDSLEVPDSLRYFYVLSRNCPDIKQYFKLTGGWVNLVDDPKFQDVFELFMTLIPEGIPLSRSELVKLATSIGANCSNFDRDYIKKAKKDGRLVDGKYGHYLKPNPS